MGDRLSSSFLNTTSEKSALLSINSSAPQEHKHRKDRTIREICTRFSLSKRRAFVAHRFSHSSPLDTIFKARLGFSHDQIGGTKRPFEHVPKFAGLRKLL